jgi:phosphatidylinositol glycan class S
MKSKSDSQIILLLYCSLNPSSSLHLLDKTPRMVASSSLVRVGVFELRASKQNIDIWQLSNATTNNFTMSASSQAPIVSEPGANADDNDTRKNEVTPANAVSVAPKKREPPPESPESIRLRSYVILSFWAIITIIGLPIWWKTTTIYRARLPLDQMMDWADGRVHLLQFSWTSSC